MAHKQHGRDSEKHVLQIPSQVTRPGSIGGARFRGVVSKPKDIRATLKRMWRFLRNERLILFAVFGFIVLHAVLTIAGPYLIGVAIDTMRGGEGQVHFNLLHIVLVVLIGAFLGESVLALLQSWLVAGMSQRVVKGLRGALFEKLQKLPLVFFDTRPHGETMSRVTNDVDNINQTISQSTIQLMAGLTTIVGTLIMMLILSPMLTLVSLITVPLVYILAQVITKRTRVLFKEQQAHLGMLNGHIEETISGLQVVKAFNHESHTVEQFEKVNDELYRISLKAQIWSGFLMPLLSVINNIGFAAIALTGGLLAVNGHITVGMIASFVSYSRQFVRPLNEIAQVYNVLQSGLAGAERVFEVLDEQEELEDSAKAVELKQPKGDIRFEHVHFSYREDVPVLKNISFHASSGTSIALVGPTGAGKTTIINLITRFYDATSGSILLDGRDIKQYSRESVRQCFGIVLQDTFLFSGTIRDNIRYGRSDATDDEIVAAARMANADAFIQRLPKQYETILSENGSSLSQGERQLIAIARVMLSNPSILILDEATSSIDTRTEQHIQQALLELMKGRTTFIIAHRLNTIRGADQILVIDRGQIVEQGTHEQLVRNRQLYYGMFNEQFKLASN